MKLRHTSAALLLIAGASQAAIVNVDLSAATTGVNINGVGADFAQLFAGQTLAGIGFSGSATTPLALQAAGSITVAAFNPGVSAASNSLLSQPGNGAPLAMLLDSLADSLSWTMGFGNGGSVAADFYGAAGSIIHTQMYSGLSDYNVFSASGFGSFIAVQFRDNNDPGGLRFQNFSYNEAVATVPEPSTVALVALALLAGGAASRRRVAA